MTVLLAAMALGAACAGTAAPTYDDVAPIFRARCVMCHTGPSAPLGLALDSLEGVRKGSGKGPVAKTSDPGGSELTRRLKGLSQPRMPMTGPPFLSDAEIGLVECWITAGLPPGTGAAGAAPAAGATRPKPGEPVTYAHVAPIFAQRCAKCHTENGQMGRAPEGYRLTSYAATLDVRDRARVVPGAPEASELLRRVRGQARPRMPFDGPPYASDDEIALIQAWIAQGARNAQGQAAPPAVGARVRLHGTLTQASSLDGLAIDTTRARIDKRPRPGDYVEVRGRVEADGSISAERLRAR